MKEITLKILLKDDAIAEDVLAYLVSKMGCFVNEQKVSQWILSEAKISQVINSSDPHSFHSGTIDRTLINSKIILEDIARIMAFKILLEVNDQTINLDKKTVSDIVNHLKLYLEDNTI